MRLFFLIPLMAGLLAGYIAKNSAAEIAYLTGVFTFISLMVSLVLAPWQLQLFILILVIIITKQIFLPSEEKMAKESHNQDVSDESTSSPAKTTEDKMVTKYRGVSYKPISSTSVISEGAIVGKYRGTPWRVHKLKQRSVLQTKSELKYRGIKIMPKSDKPEPENLSESDL